jgi:hypothetical protein
MSDLPKTCPVCGDTFKWYETECPVDHVRLVDRPGPPPDPGAALVVVFRTGESGLLALASMALDQEAIEYDVRDPGLNDQLVGYRQAAGTSSIDVPSEILVRAEDADRARDLLSDLGAAMPAAAEIPPPAADSNRAGMPEHEMLSPSVTLVDDEGGRPVGRITEEQLAWLAERLEQESADDSDYYIDRPTLEMLAELGAEQTLIDMLGVALGERDGMTIRWLRG